MNVDLLELNHRLLEEISNVQLRMVEVLRENFQLKTELEHAKEALLDKKLAKSNKSAFRHAESYERRKAIAKPYVAIPVTAEDLQRSVEDMIHIVQDLDAKAPPTEQQEFVRPYPPQAASNCALPPPSYLEKGGGFWMPPQPEVIDDITQTERPVVDEIAQTEHPLYPESNHLMASWSSGDSAESDVPSSNTAISLVPPPVILAPSRSGSKRDLTVLKANGASTSIISMSSDPIRSKSSAVFFHQNYQPSPEEPLTSSDHNSIVVEAAMDVTPSSPNKRDLRVTRSNSEYRIPSTSIMSTPHKPSRSKSTAFLPQVDHPGPQEPLNSSDRNSVVIQTAVDVPPSSPNKRDIRVTRSNSEYRIPSTSIISMSSDPTRSKSVGALLLNDQLAPEEPSTSTDALSPIRSSSSRNSIVVQPAIDAPSSSASKREIRVTKANSEHVIQNASITSVSHNPARSKSTAFLPQVDQPAPDESGSPVASRKASASRPPLDPQPVFFAHSKPGSSLELGGAVPKVTRANSEHLISSTTSNSMSSKPASQSAKFEPSGFTQQGIKSGQQYSKDSSRPVLSKETLSLLSASQVERDEKINDDRADEAVSSEAPQSSEPESIPEER